MKILGAFLLAVLITTTSNAATEDEIRQWKARFPNVSVSSSFGLRQLVSKYELEVSQTTTANLDAKIRRLRQRAETDLREASRTAQVREGPSANEAREKQRWLVNSFLPYVRTMG
jgi:hypothetical protein